MPNVPDEMDRVIQPLIPQPIHTTPPNDYVAPATKSILDELLEEFKDEIMNVTMVDEEAAKDPQSHFTEIQGSNKGMEFEKPSRDFTHPLGPPSGLKGLLHMLNATVIPTKPYMLCTGGGAWILNKLRGSIANNLVGCYTGGW
ncbi:hypothetical protein Tco_0009417 [Tanacetum coccineum]